MQQAVAIKQQAVAIAEIARELRRNRKTVWRCLSQEHSIVERRRNAAPDDASRFRP